MYRTLDDPAKSLLLCVDFFSIFLLAETQEDMGVNRHFQCDLTQASAFLKDSVERCMTPMDKMLQVKVSFPFLRSKFGRRTALASPIAEVHFVSCTVKVIIY